MPQYLVRWEIDVDADSPLKAARKARQIQIRRGTQATVFDVFEAGRKSLGPVAQIDLTYPKESKFFEEAQKTLAPVTVFTRHAREQLGKMLAASIAQEVPK